MMRRPRIRMCTFVVFKIILKPPWEARYGSGYITIENIRILLDTQNKNQMWISFQLGHGSMACTVHSYSDFFSLGTSFRDSKSCT